MRKVYLFGLSLIATGAYSAENTEFTAAQRTFWSLQQVKKPAVPAVKEAAWVKNPIDAFVLAKLQDKDILPNPPATKSAMLRRVTIDLTGLPPTEAELGAFLQDPSPDAYEAVVDRLLASPAYGERWGRHWLDVARYADSNGYKADETRPNMWRYRDYVIDAFNADKPYDRFIREQIAGDELYPGDPEALVAMGFNRNWIDETNAAGLVIRRQETLDDMTNVTGAAFLGVTLACARCHDHKYDPITIKDYYRLQAFFANTSFGDGPLPPKDPAERRKYEEQKSAWEQKTKDIRAEMAEIVEPLRKTKITGGIKTFEDDVQEAILLDASKRTPWQQMMFHTASPRITFNEEPDARTLRGLGTEPAKRFADLKAQLAQFDAIKPARMQQEGQFMIDIGPIAPPTYIHRGGSPYAQGDQVQPGFLSILDPADAKIVAPDGLNSTGRRSALAAWLTDPKNPLVARVMVNRIWQSHFGTGIVATAGDFGRMGQRPTHPELLDYLAASFVENGWSMKKLHKLIVLSNTYQQSSDAQAKGLDTDPDNKLLWRYSRRRMEAEAIRDSMLAVSGLLNAKMGGPGVYPPVPTGAVSDLSATAAAGGWKKETDASQNNRRSVYIFVRRNLRYPMLMEFDSANTFEVWHSRKNTVTPSQSLDLLNNTLVVDWARTLAGRVLAAGNAKTEDRYTKEWETAKRALCASPTGAVSECVSRESWAETERLIRTAYGRPATADDYTIINTFLKAQFLLLNVKSTATLPMPVGGAPKDMPPALAAAYVDLCQMLLASNEFLYIN